MSSRQVPVPVPQREYQKWLYLRPLANMFGIIRKHFLRGEWLCQPLVYSQRTNLITKLQTDSHRACRQGGQGTGVGIWAQSIARAPRDPAGAPGPIKDFMVLVLLAATAISGLLVNMPMP